MPVRPDKLTPKLLGEFREAVWQHYRRSGRTFPWRQTRDPFEILVSEIMLQQTQVQRVVAKYGHFIGRFPDLACLAGAELRDILDAWNGLGYNRRALALQKIAQRVVSEFGGELPDVPETLRTFPCIGAATAGALTAFVFGKPAVFIETNIRRAFLHFFFADKDRVRDEEILPLIEATLDTECVRTWYYALMDYGAMLKGARENPNRRSAHYSRQPPFRNSRRYLRGFIIKTLVARGVIPLRELVRMVGKPLDIIEPIIGQLMREGFIQRQDDHVSIRSTT
jgi:A/G-specific adenine glycosylase